MSDILTGGTMKPSNTLPDSSRIAALAILCVAILMMASPAAVHAETDVTVPAFKSVDLRNGGHVILRHGSKQRVRVVQGNTKESAIRVEEDGRLVIDRCPDGCPRGYTLEVEIVTPEIGALSVTDGGWLRSSGTFPKQASLAVAVESGGTLDMRSMNVGAVAAAVLQGGRIFTEPRETLTAAISQGGAVLYWGNPDVRRSIQHGGVVSRGKAADRDRPFEKIGGAVEH